MNANRHPQNGSPKSPSVNFPEPASAEKCAPDLFACAKEPPPIKTQKIDLDELLGGVKENKKPEKKPPLDKLIAEVQEGIDANMRAYEKSQASASPSMQPQYKQAPSEPPKAANPPSAQDKAPLQKQAGASVPEKAQKRDPAIYADAVEMMKRAHKENDYSLLARIRLATGEKFKERLLDPAKRGAAFQEILAEKVMDYQSVSELLTYRMLDKSTEDKGTYRYLPGIVDKKIECDREALKYINALNAIDAAPGTSLKIRASQINFSSMQQQVNNAKEAQKAP